MANSWGQVQQVSSAFGSRIKSGLIIAVAVIALAFSVSPQAAYAQSFSFSTVEVEGNQRVDVPTILSFAGISRGETLSAGELNSASQALLDSGLFETVEFEPRGSTLLIKVSEYPTINVIAFEGNRRIDDEVLGQIVQSQSRRIYNPSLAEADAAAIVVGYANEGRLAATVSPKLIPRSDNRVDLVFEIVEGRVIEVQRLSFVGNRNFSDRRLRRALETKQAGLFRAFIRSDTFIEDRVAFDQQILSDFYQSRGYVDFQVLSVSSELARSRDAFVLTFNIQEGQKFRIGEVTVVSDLNNIDPDAYLDASNLRSGNVYSPTILENNIARLERKAVQDGIDFVRVDPRITRNDRDLTLDVEFALVRGDRIFVERIDIEGNATTLDRVIRRQFDTVEGDPFNPREIRETAERIRALGFFANADVSAREGSSPDQVIVDVDVEEQPTGALSFGASYSTSNGVGLSAGFSERNFLGRGQTVSFNFTTGVDNSQASFGFFEPSFLSRDVGFRLNLGYSETDSQDSNRFDTTTFAFVPSLEFPVGEYSRLGIRYGLNSTDITDYNGDSVLLQAEADRGQEVASRVGYTYSYDTRSVGLNPDAGVLLRFSQDAAGLGGDSRFIETGVLIAAETTAFSGDLQLRAEFEGGFLQYLNGDSRITDRFTGNGKIRGFENNGIGPRDLASSNNEALGGNNFAVARFEAQFPLGLPEEYGITGGVFADIGSVWGLDNDLNGQIDDSLNIRSAVGFSIFWTTGIGPLRFNFSEAIQKESYDETQNFELTIQTRF